MGAALLRLLIYRGWKIRALVHRNPRPLEGLDVEQVHGSLSDPDSLRTLVRGADVVFHLAARIEIGPGDEASLFRTNVEGTRRVLAATKEGPRLVHFGTIEAFLAEGVRRIDEAAELQVRRATTVYGLSKALAQRLVDDAAASGQDVVTVCPTAVLGPYDHGPSLMGRALLTLAKFRFLPVPDGGFDFVDSRDVALGAVAAAERGERGRRYLLAGQWASVRDLSLAVDATLGRRSLRPVLPTRLLGAFSGPMALWNRIAGTDLVNAESLKLLASGVQVDSSRSRRALGLGQPRSPRAAVRDALQWFQNHGYL